MYTVDASFSSSSFSFVAISRFISDSFISLYIAPGSLPPCPGYLTIQVLV